MATPPDTIDHATLAHLVEAGAVRGAEVIGQPGGWGVVVKYGMTERTLAVRRGQARIFRRFETVVAYLKDLGLSRYAVDASHYDPATPASGTRPDSAERLKRAHEAAEHDHWFREQVQTALDDPRPAVSHEEAKAAWMARRAELLARAKGGAA
jgi:hypothetical protein